jgi:hypothetical protein
MKVTVEHIPNFLSNFLVSFQEIRYAMKLGRLTLYIYLCTHTHTHTNATNSYECLIPRYLG